MAVDVECAVVGGGIGGAVLALALAQRGHRVAILEREARQAAANRPEILAQATMDVFHGLGAAARILQDAALALQGLELWDSSGRRLFALAQDDFRRAGTQPYATDPARTREILLDLAMRSSVQVRRGVEVQGLSREHGNGWSVRGTQHDQPVALRARLIVGDDGLRSRVREHLGIRLATQEFPLEFLSAAGPALPGQPARVVQAWIQPRAARDGLFGVVMVPLPGERVAMVFLLSALAQQHFAQGSPAAFYEAAARLSPRCQALEGAYRFPDAFAHHRRPFGHAPRYVADGAALLGDAAHPVTPAGGQGANMSVADGAALSAVAHEALTSKDCSSAALAPYQADRWPANERSIQFSARTRAVVRLLGMRPWLAPMVPWLIGRADRQAALKQRLLGAVSSAFTSSGMRLSPAKASGA